MKSLHKQLLALLLSLLMVVSMGILPVAADQTAETTAATEAVDNVEDAAPVASEKAKAMVEKWASLGVISADTDPLATVTRGSFAKMLGDLLGVSGVSAAREITDVNDEIAGAVRAARDLGFFEITDGKFHPDDSVSVSEALKVMAVLIGYPANLVSNNGGSLALQARLCKGIDASHASACTWEVVLQLMENVAKEEIVRVIGYADGKAFSAEPAKDATILTEYLRIYDAKGTITATSTTAIDGGKAIKGGVRIDGVKYTDKAGLANKVGYAVKVWYKLDKNENRTIMYAEPLYKDQQTWTIADTDILPSTTTETVYYADPEDDGDTEEIDISEAIFVYNGSYLAAPEDADLKPVTGQLEIVDNEGDDVAEVVYISSSEAYVVKDVNAQVRYLSDKYDDAKTIRFKDSCELTVLRRGEVASMSDIKTNNVVYVGMSKDGKTAVLDIYAVQQRGTLTGIDDEYLYIDGAPYLIGKTNEDEMRSLELGAKYTFYLGMNEAVLGAAPQVSMDTYGYLTRATYKEDGLSNYGVFRIFDQTYGFMNYHTADQVYVNGVPKTPALAVEAVKDGGVVEPQAIMFRTNEDGELTHLQLAYETPSNQLYNEAVFSKDVVLRNTQVKLPGLVDSKFMFGGDMLTILVPKDASGNIIEDGVAVIPYAKLNLDYATYSGIAYDITADRNVKLFIWEKVGSVSTTADNEDMFIVGDIYKKLNRDGQVATFVDGIRGNEQLSLEVSQDMAGVSASAIKPGDVLVIATDAMNRLTGAKHIYTLKDRGVAPLYKEIYGYSAYNADMNTPQRYTAVTNTNIMGVHNSYAHCKPTRVMGNNMLLKFSDDVPESLIGPTGGPVVTVFDEETETLRFGNLAADMMPYDENQTALVFMYSGRWTRVLIINHKAPMEYTSWLYEPFTTASIGSNGLPGHFGSSETWSSANPLNMEIVDAAGRGKVLKVTDGVEKNLDKVVVNTATSDEVLKNSYSYTLSFRVNIENLVSEGETSVRVGGAANAIAFSNGTMYLANGNVLTSIMPYAEDTWYEIVMQVTKTSATSTSTAVFVNGERRISNTANDGNWSFNGENGYFNIQSADWADGSYLQYSMLIDDVLIDWNRRPESINADGEVPSSSDLVIPNYLERDEFKDAVISDGTASNGDGSNVSWIAGNDTMSIVSDPNEAGDKLLKISNSSVINTWDSNGAKLSSPELTSGASATGYTLEFKMAVESNTTANDYYGPRPIFLMFGNGWLAFNNVGGRMYFGLSGENGDWGQSIVAGPVASKGIAYEAIGNLAAGGWYIVTIHVHGAGLVDISITDGTNTISITDKTVNAGSAPTPQKNGYYLGINHGVNSGATNPWTLTFDYIAMDIED